MISFTAAESDGEEDESKSEAGDSVVSSTKSNITAKSEMLKAKLKAGKKISCAHPTR